MTSIATFTLTLSTTATTSVSVDYTTVDGTAKAGVNYTASTGTVVFPPGATTETVVINVTPVTTDASFSIVLSNPMHCNLTTGTSGVAVIVGTGIVTVDYPYLDRFNYAYTALKTQSNGYFGPTTGPKAYQMPYHSVETLIAEAPDWGHESVSETVSFWVKLETWKVALTGVTTGYTAVWNSIENNYVPSATNQPYANYTPATPATYQPEANDPSSYPTLPNTTFTVGADPLGAPLLAQYGTLNLYLMHWLWDVDGVFGFHNGDATTVAVAINNFSRGLHEGLFATVTHVAWEDWTQGGNAYGFLPIYSQSTPTYPSAPFAYDKQFSYTSAPDAEMRAIGSAFLANKFATAQSLSTSVQDIKAKKLGDYVRYVLYDKYFRAIPGYDGSGAHNLISWYNAWGGQIPASGASAWGYRIGSSESHFGYNGVDAAYAMSPSGGGYTPLTTGAGTQWQNSLSRQLEMIRWLQSPEGPIAGGVSNSWEGQYLTPTDGRQTAKFYGLYYTYSPVYHSPPSNNWVGYQGWGLERVAALYLTTATKTDTFSVNIHQNCGVILDKFMPWLLANVTVTAGVISMPTTLSWTSNTAVSGQTTTTTNVDGVYEWLPNLNWDSTGNYSTFWSNGAVPNVNLHCAITSTGISMGIAASFAQLMLEYAQAKRTATGGALTNTIPNTSHTIMECYTLAKALMDSIWGTMQDSKGFTSPETRGDYTGYAQATYIPSGFNGAMHHGEALNGSTTFKSARSFLTSDPQWSKVTTYLAGGAAPVFSYHRFWENTECAAGFAMIHKYFPDLAYA